MTDLTRRRFGQLSFAAFAFGSAASLPGFSLAANPTGERLFGLSAFGALKYDATATALDYVNVDAPKGGVMNFSVPNWTFNQNVQTFDTLNTFTLKNNAPPRMELTYDALMFAAADEPAAIYGMLAESVEISNDRNAFTFELRPEAKFHDGSSVTAEDVVFTYETFKRDGHPSIVVELSNLASVEALDERRVRLTFDGQQADRTILTVSVLPIISKAFFAGRDFLDMGLTPVLGSGPYKVGRVDQGVVIEYERVEDYWARDLWFAKGRSNFDRLRIEFYRERQAAFEAFKKGEITWRQEFTSKTWAQDYDFPAMEDGRAVKKLFDGEKIASFQAWAVNRRRAKFADPRTVQAINHCFDFEWTNENLFFGAYERGQGYFTNSNYLSTGEPEGEELALLKSLSAPVDDAVFGPVPMMPVSDGSGRDRKLLREANRLFSEAGWKRDGSQLVDDAGQPLTVEFLIRSPTFERILGPFVNNLKTLGVEANIALVDPSAFQRRLDTFDFDIVGSAFRVGALPTANGLRNFFGTESATQEGSRNYGAIAKPAVDELIGLIGKADTVELLTVRLRALDRVLRNLHSWIPNWNSANHRVAYWDLFDYPATKPDYDFPFETTWWWNAEKAAAQSR